MTSVICSCLFKLKNYQDEEVFRPFEEYEQQAIELFKSHSDIKFVVFTDEKTTLGGLSNVQIIQVKLSDISADLLMKDLLLPTHRHSTKDTQAYMAIQLSKHRMMYICQLLTGAEQVLWLDAGCSKHFKIEQDHLRKLMSTPVCGIYVPGMKFPYPEKNSFNIYEQILWTAAGTIFYSDKHYIAKFYALMEQEIKNMLAKNRITWEVNIYHNLMCSIDSFITFVSCQTHDSSLVTNLLSYLERQNDFVFKTDIDIFNIAKKYTAVSAERLWWSIHACADVILQKVPGKLVEVGVFTGGNIIAFLAKMLQNALRRENHVVAIDTYDGLIKDQVTVDDVEFSTNFNAKDIFDNIKCECSLNAFLTNVYNALPFGRHMLRIQKQDITKDEFQPHEDISLLRCDVDFYQPVKACIQKMEHLVVNKGFVCFDDYYWWKGCQKAVKETLPDQEMIRIDNDGCYYRKKLA